MSTKQDKRNKRAKKKASQANKNRAQGRQLDAIGRQNYQLTPEMVELFTTLPVPHEGEEFSYVAGIYNWSRLEYAFDGQDAEEEMLQVAALCVMFENWLSHDGATTLMHNVLIERALQRVDKSQPFQQCYQDAAAAALTE